MERVGHQQLLNLTKYVVFVFVAVSVLAMLSTNSILVLSLPLFEQELVRENNKASREGGACVFNEFRGLEALRLEYSDHSSSVQEVGR